MNGMTKRMLGTQVIVEGKPSHIRYLPQDDTYEFALEFYHSSWQTVYVNQIPVSIHALVLLLPKQWEALMKQIEKRGEIRLNMRMSLRLKDGESNIYLQRK
jgi:hypothetical protein